MSVNFEANLKKGYKAGGQDVIRNLADDLASLFDATHNEKYRDYVHSVKTVKHSKYPIMILMPKNIVKLLKRLCTLDDSARSILGCDTTFNLTSALGIDFLVIYSI